MSSKPFAAVFHARIPERTLPALPLPTSAAPIPNFGTLAPACSKPSHSTAAVLNSKHHDPERLQPTRDKPRSISSHVRRPLKTNKNSAASSDGACPPSDAGNPLTYRKPRLRHPSPATAAVSPPKHEPSSHGIRAQWRPPLRTPLPHLQQPPLRHPPVPSLPSTTTSLTPLSCNSPTISRPKNIPTKSALEPNSTTSSTAIPSQKKTKRPPAHQPPHPPHSHSACNHHPEEDYPLAHHRHHRRQPPPSPRRYRRDLLCTQHQLRYAKITTLDQRIEGQLITYSPSLQDPQTQNTLKQALIES